MISAADLVIPTLYPEPRWFPQAWDATREWMRMLRFDAEDYRAAPFLDSRGIRKGMPVALVPFALLEAHTPADARRDAHWIFHISHVGSTLISRLLGELDGTIAYREPQPLARIAAMSPAERNARIPVLRALLSRTFDPTQRAIVKATSSVSEYAVDLIGPPGDGSKALFIDMAPKRFIGARLVSESGELEQRAAVRLKRLQRRIPGLDPKVALSSAAHLAAMAWAAERCAVEAAHQAVGADRAMLLDFDAFLAEPTPKLEAVARHFDLTADRAAIEEIVNGPMMGSYSKNSARSFDLEHREAEIVARLKDHGSEVAAAMRWLETTAQRSPLLTAALDRQR